MINITYKTNNLFNIILKNDISKINYIIKTKLYNLNFYIISNNNIPPDNLKDFSIIQDIINNINSV